MSNGFKVFFHKYILPCNLLSRITYFLMHAKRFPFRDPFVTFMIKRHSIQVQEALEPDYTDRRIHPNINSFFVRALRPDARPIAAGEDELCSPADGTISQIGKINHEQIIQAKGHSFSAVDLLGGSEERAKPFLNGNFTTIYLSPSDYHRVHIPFGGKLQEMVHIPGKLLSVAPFLIDAVPNLFANNERVACLFETSFGPMAIILVGAVNVGSIETVWAGEITPPRGLKVTDTPYEGDDAIELKKGEELGRFNMGSTVIMLFPPDTIKWQENLKHDDRIQMGKLIATLL